MHTIYIYIYYVCVCVYIYIYICICKHASYVWVTHSKVGYYTEAASTLDRAQLESVCPGQFVED